MSHKSTLNKKNHTSKVYLIGALLALTAFIFTASLSHNQSSSPRTVASTEKVSHFQSHNKKHAFQHHQKMKAPIHIQVEPLNDQAIEVQTPFTLIAKISTTVDTSLVTVTWNLPQWAKIISGETTTTIPDLKTGEDKEIYLTISVDSIENVQIHAIAKAQFGSITLADTAQFNTLLEKKFKEEKEMLVKRTKTYIKKHKKSY